MNKKSARLPRSHRCLSALYEAVSSSNSLLFISISVFNTLYTSATIVLKDKEQKRHLSLVFFYFNTSEQKPKHRTRAEHRIGDILYNRAVKEKSTLSEFDKQKFTFE